MPEDRDQAFIMNDGFMMTLYRMVRPQQVEFGPEYPDLAGLTFNAWELDRQLLTELDRSTWREVAEEIATELTDEVIEQAVFQLPLEIYEMNGAELEEALRARRDNLHEAWDELYRMMSDKVDVRTTNADEEIVIAHNWDELRRLILDRVRASKGTGLGDRLPEAGGARPAAGWTAEHVAALRDIRTLIES